MNEERIIKISRGNGIDDNIVGLSTSRIIIEKYGSDYEIVNNNNYSIAIKYKSLGISFSYRYGDPVELIYLMSATGEVDAITETGLIFDKNLTLLDASKHYGQGNAYASEVTDDAYLRYPGILFYFSKRDSELFEVSDRKSVV